MGELPDPEPRPRDLLLGVGMSCGGSRAWWFRGRGWGLSGEVIGAGLWSRAKTSSESNDFDQRYYASILRGWFRTTFQALENPQYRLLWLGSLFSMLAFMMQWTVQAVVAFDIAGTNSAVGVVQLGVGLSMLLLGPFGGVIADRVSKKPLVFWGEFLIALSMAATGLLVILGALTILWLTLLTAVMGLVFAFLGPALQAWVGQMVPPRLLRTPSRSVSCR